MVKKKNIYYRRYSDDIVVICKVFEIEIIKNYFENLIKESKVEISTAKTEVFIFEHLEYNALKNKRLTSIKLNNDGTRSISSPLIYLGFEFRGFNVLIKSTNLSKFYRRLINIVKRRARRAFKVNQKDPLQKKAIYLNQIKKLYNKPLKEMDSENNELKQKFRTKSILELNERGEYSFIKKEAKSKMKNSNYMGYVKRCCEIFKSDHFENQLRKRKYTVHTAINRHLK